MKKLLTSFFVIIILALFSGCQVYVEKYPEHIKTHVLGQVITSGVPDPSGLIILNRYNNPDSSNYLSMRVYVNMVSWTRGGRPDPLLGSGPKLIYRVSHSYQGDLGEGVFARLPAIPLQNEFLIVKVTFFDRYGQIRGEAKASYTLGSWDTWRASWTPWIGEGVDRW